jgi:succinyl-CoA synthetase alpha subunit
MIFSDNVPIQAEIALKQQARAAGLLVMGPDCGTAIIGGVPLAFANQVPRGDIGIIGASGTGIQEVSCQIATLGRGVSHAIGVGGRDLRAEVGGVTTLMALDILDADPATDQIVLVSKPPASTVASRIAARIEDSPKTFTVCFIGSDDVDLPGNARLAPTLRDAARLAVGLDPMADPLDAVAPPPHHHRERTEISGLFAGGTLCSEAQMIMKRAGFAVSSNVPISGVAMIGREIGDVHRLIDLGHDDYTQGRPHPMIDPSVRDQPLAAALNDPKVGVVLLDVVLGHGGHPDPAGHLAAFLKQRSSDGRLIVASVTGTDNDPQCRSTQVEKLASIGVKVAHSNADAVAFALNGLSRRA